MTYILSHVMAFLNFTEKNTVSNVIISALVQEFHDSKMKVARRVRMELPPPSNSNVLLHTISRLVILYQCNFHL